MTGDAPTRHDLVLRSSRVELPGGPQPATVCVAAGRIAAILPHRAPAAGIRERDLGDLALLPGLVDTHVHTNEPGRTGWEGFDSITRAAARGGVTTLIDMPLNSVPPTTTVAALEVKRVAAAGRCHVDVGFWGGAVPDNDAHLAPLHEAGVFGFKCFLADSGVPEFPPLSPHRFEAVARRLADLGAVLLVHAEDAAVLRRSARSPAELRGSNRRYADFLTSRPDSAETTAVAAALGTARRTRARTHILHVSSALALEQIGAARREGVPVTAETCPHYLFFEAEQVPDGATEFKCCPPIRGAANRERLWDALGENVIDFVVSDHSPCEPELKLRQAGDFGGAWGGIASIELSLPAVWTRARERGLPLSRVVELMARRTADFAGLPGKGRIEVGADADLVVFDPDRQWQVDAAQLAHRHPVTPYHGRILRGAVLDTYLRGERISGAEPLGRLLRRPVVARG